MRRTACFPLAVLSALTAAAATHPRYGGTLRVEGRGAPAALEACSTEPAAALIYEPLVRLDESGFPQPWLATEWHAEGNGKRWQFTLRAGVKLQDGSALSAGAIASSIPGSTAAGDRLVIPAAHGITSLLLELAAKNCMPSGPFRLSQFEAGRRAVFTANEDYWGGRPFLDAVEVEWGRTLRDQAADLDLGKADVTELATGDLRRNSERGRSIWSSLTVRLVALAAEPGHLTDPRLRESLALSIDRAAMHNVLLQKQGEASGAMVPDWISGYAFAFPALRDVAKASAAATGLVSRNITLSFDAAMPSARVIAERIAVNARDAGLSVQVVAQPRGADVRLIERRIHEFDASRALAAAASSLGGETMVPFGPLQAIYEAERRLMENNRIIPLFHIPELYATAARVHSFGGPAITRLGDWNFGSVWLGGSAP